MAIEAVEGKANLARHLGVSKQAIGFWDIIPADRLIEVETVTGVPRKLLRPDLFINYELVKPSRKSKQT